METLITILPEDWPTFRATVRVGAAKQILADRLAEFMICADWPNSFEIHAGQWRNERTRLREP